MDNKPNAVLDTNVFMVSILPHHKYYWIFDTLLKTSITCWLAMRY